MVCNIFGPEVQAERQRQNRHYGVNSVLWCLHCVHVGSEDFQTEALATLTTSTLYKYPKTEQTATV
jgi:hypothetical protein